MPRLPDTHHKKPAMRSAFHVKKNSAATAPIWKAIMKEVVIQLTWLSVDGGLASASISLASSGGRTNQPTRNPGATVFENEEAYATFFPSASSNTLGRGSPS